MLCEEFNKLANTLSREEKQPRDPYLWLAEDNGKRNLTDREIFKIYFVPETSCLTLKEKEELMDLLYTYKVEFSLRDEIGICTNI